MHDPDGHQAEGGRPRGGTAAPAIEVVFAPPDAERDARILRKVYAVILGGARAEDG